VTHQFRFDTEFEKQAARTPEAVALRSSDGTVTYADLDTRANRVANHLRATGISPGAFVGLHLERSPDAVAALLGILKAGGAVVPLPPSWPTDRVGEILRFARLDAVIHADATPLATHPDTRAIRLGDALRGDATTPPRTGGSDGPAFVICSSGSTGMPKMIVRSHASFLHRLQWTWGEHPFAADDVCVQKSFQATTHAVYELFEPLLRGVAVRIVPDEALRDLVGFWSLLSAERVTRLLIVPSMLQAALELPEFAAPPLRVLVLMGEHVPARLASRVTAAFPKATQIFSIYGSSEASSTLVTDLRSPRNPDDDPPLGKPISPDVRVDVRDGVLYVAGTPLFTEYFRNPEGTAAVLDTRGSERLYRTGDQVRVREDGSLVFAGRADGVVKVRGFRVDVGEVEHWLSRGPGVGQCVVVAHPDTTAAATLVGFVTPAGAPTPAIFAWLRSYLPPYMLPSTIVAVDDFPRTPSGKIDRLRLARDHSHAPADANPARYESETERSVAAVWGELLGVRTIERDSSFFEIGGTSLTVFAAAHRLREQLGLTTAQLGAATIYAHPTLAALAAAIERVRRGDPPVAATSEATVLVTLRRGDGSGSPPLFVIPPAGGTLGAYEKVVRALRTTRDVIGLRDPFLSGARDPTEGFQRWARRYTDAVRHRQPDGPYHILAYSSAGALGYEIAQQLRADGEEVGLLALVDPVALDRSTQWRFGYWALRIRFSRPVLQRIVRWGGAVRAWLPRVVRARRTAANANDWTVSRSEFDARASAARTNRDFILRFSALLEMNTGRPFALGERQLDAVTPSGYLNVLLSRVRDVDPTIDAEMIERALVLYDVQVLAQHRYRLQRYDGTVHLFEVAGLSGGLIAAQLRPYVRKLYGLQLEMTNLSPRMRELLEPYGEALRGHYGCMRNDAFTDRLAAELDTVLETLS